METTNLAEIQIRLYYLRLSKVYSTNKQVGSPVKDQKVVIAKNSDQEEMKQPKK